MLQLVTLRNEAERVKERLGVRNFREIDLVDKILGLDDERRKLTFQFDDTKAKINTASKEIGMLMGKGKNEEAAEGKKNVESLKNSLQPIQEKLERVEKDLNEMLVRLPNLPHESV